MVTSVLRIGNYVLHEGRIIIVTSVFPKGINARLDPATGKIAFIRADAITPVPLSTDLLVRFGFRRAGTRWTMPRVHGLYIDRAVNRYRISIGHMGSSVCPVQFVHQLQNLFFDGWGVELRLR